MTAAAPPFREPIATTLLRNGVIAMIIGAVLALRWGGLPRWPETTLLALWPSFGGHFVELGFRNWLRPRLPRARAVQIAARLATWAMGGALLAAGMVLTNMALTGFQVLSFNPRWLWMGAAGFIGIELIVHLALQLRGQSSFYNGRG